MHTNILEMLPVIDYQELYRKLEERGEVKGKTETQMDIAIKAFYRLRKGSDLSRIEQMLKELDIPDDIIKAAKAAAIKEPPARKRAHSEPER